MVDKKIKRTKVGKHLSLKDNDFDGDEDNDGCDKHKIVTSFLISVIIILICILIWIYNWDNLSTTNIVQKTNTENKKEFEEQISIHNHKYKNVIDKSKRSIRIMGINNIIKYNNYIDAIEGETLLKHDNGLYNIKTNGYLKIPIINIKSVEDQVNRFLEYKLQINKLKKVVSPGDGSCFYHSIINGLGDQINDNNNTPEKLRKLISNRLLEIEIPIKEAELKKVQDELKALDKDSEDYKTKIESNKTEALQVKMYKKAKKTVDNPNGWAEQITIAILSNILNIKINIFTIDTKNILSYTPDIINDDMKIINVLYKQGVHYDSLIDKDNITQEDKNLTLAELKSKDIDLYNEYKSKYKFLIGHSIEIINLNNINSFYHNYSTNKFGIMECIYDNEILTHIKIQINQFQLHEDFFIIIEKNEKHKSLRI